MGRVVFACGASIRSLEDPTPHASHVREGRVRLAVYDSERMPSRPKTVIPPSGAPDDDGDVIVANCMFGCRHKRAGGRRQIRCFAESKSRETWRWIVTCYGRWEP